MGGHHPHPTFYVDHAPSDTTPFEAAMMIANGTKRWF
jgi:hypothetical protein